MHSFVVVVCEAVVAAVVQAVVFVPVDGVFAAVVTLSYLAVILTDFPFVFL